MNRADHLSEIDEAKLRLQLEHEPLRTRVLIEILLQTGLRTSEVIGLRRGEIWDGGAVVERIRMQRSRLKGGRNAGQRSVKGRLVPVTERLRIVLESYCAASAGLGPDEFLFPGGDDGHIARESVARLVRAVCLRAGLPAHKTWSGHSLRRTFARAVAEVGGSDAARQALGHAHLQTTEVYLRLDEDEVHAAILAVGRVQPPNSLPIAALGHCPAEASALRKQSYAG